MENRQKYLLLAFGAMVVLTVGDRLWTSMYARPLEVAERSVTQLTAEIEEGKLRLRRAKRDSARLDQLREVSLPEDVEAARTFYQGWLTDAADAVEFDGVRVDSNPPKTYDGYRLLPFSLRCSGTLEQLTAWLYDFYQAPIMHHIGTLTITPVAGSRRLSLNLAIEALAVDGTENRETLPPGASDQLADGQLDAYDPIVRRNFFSASGGVAATAYTALTAIVSVDQFPEAWFTNLLEDKVVQVRVGERFRVGVLDCQVEQISVRDVILVVDDQRWLLTIDDRLADAIALPPEF